MEFYDAVNTRRTVRDWQDRDVSSEQIGRILNAALKAPTNDHNRQWEFVILRDAADKERALAYVKKAADRQVSAGIIPADATPARKMYAYAMPRQYTMLAYAPFVIIPFFKGAGIYRASSLSALNSFASIWCAIENIFLAASAEGLACSVRIPLPEEAKSVEQIVEVPEGYAMACYIGVGYATEESRNLEQNMYSLEQKVHYGKW